jgi:tyrosyl-tRNA synthetase
MKEEIAKKEIEELFTRGVGSFVDPEGKFKEKLLKKIEGKYSKDIIIKFGVDPTRPDIHLGHAVVFRKLRKLQELGCKVVFLIGDYTAQIGDPTGKSKVRPEIEQKEVEANMKTYLDQVGKILLTDPKVFSWIRNSDWFTAITDLGFPQGEKINFTIEQNGTQITAPLEANSMLGKTLMFEQTRMQGKILGLRSKISVVTLKGFLWTLRHITHSKLIERDMFEERITKQEDLYMHEMMYPVLQGIDSFVLAEIYGSCDLEIGGTDQTFNMLMGRDIMRYNNQEPQSVLSIKLLEGTDGKQKMSKSLDNYVAINDEPNNMFGKIMSVPDSSIVNYFELCTYTPAEEIEKIKSDLKKINPRDIKVRLAKEIVEMYHGREAARQAEENFENTFKKGGIPEGTPEVKAEKGKLLIDILLEQKIISSKSDFRRLISEGAVTEMESGEKVESADYKISKNSVFRVGKKRFIKISL